MKATPVATPQVFFGMGCVMMTVYYSVEYVMWRIEGALIFFISVSEWRTVSNASEYKPQILHYIISLNISSNTPTLTHLIIHPLHLNDTHFKSYFVPSGLLEIPL